MNIVWPGEEPEQHLQEAQEQSGWDGRGVYDDSRESFPVYVGLVATQLTEVVKILDKPKDANASALSAAQMLLAQQFGIDLQQMFSFPDWPDRFRLVVDRVCTHDGRCVRVGFLIASTHALSHPPHSRPCACRQTMSTYNGKMRTIQADMVHHPEAYKTSDTVSQSGYGEHAWWAYGNNYGHHTPLPAVHAGLRGLWGQRSVRHLRQQALDVSGEAEGWTGEG